ncbi:MAG: fumarylacetoacetate hydrolase family protein [Chloroflexia bacterium]|nr:fumarylacetoacetate hydrolase family protein [Chloroflexia bacterium]
MKIVRFAKDDGMQAHVGILDGETVFVAEGEEFVDLRKGAEVGALADVKLLPPVEPGKIVCVGLNYAAHVTENDASRQVPDEPVLFMKPNSTIIGPNEPIAIANPEHRTDFEAELVVVIGRQARDVMESQALDYVRGYTAGNDVSDRVLQRKDGQWVRAKGFDTYCPLGPWMETDLDPSDVKVLSRLNGEARQSQTTKSLLFSVPFLISYISGVMTLDPGDIIMTGTPEGVGPLTAGDTIEVEIGGIGVLSNPVVNRAR